MKPERSAMQDMIFIGVTLVFFVATAFAIVAMEKI